MILSFVTIYPVSGEEDKVADLLASMHGLIATKPECTGCRVLLERGEQNTICYLERWSNRESFEHHLRSSDYTRILEAMELSSRPPDVEFFQGQNFGGLEVVELVRLCGKGSLDQNPFRKNSHKQEDDCNDL
ncbi:MAG: putative quinol monooxygenase [Desulfobulbus sp.]